MQTVIARCDGLASQPTPPTLRQLAELLAAVELSGEALREAQRPDPRRPYGRRVFLDTPVMEGMLATWTPGAWCAPHDHGGSVGGVRVLQGRARHRVFCVRDGGLALLREEQIEAGAVISCGPSLVHAMRCDGGDAGLVTLHLYAGPIPWMTVYDVEGQETLQVSGGCGAWIPHDQPELIRARAPGLVPPQAFPSDAT
ncbi:MAG: cysteine dioxygenase family protein [Alphaproteobacteria bacterium]|nr:cysteine dioxygenase family protein [Alphaproteobacteria bacterium]